MAYSIEHASAQARQFILTGVPEPSAPPLPENAPYASFPDEDPPPPYKTMLRKEDNGSGTCDAGGTFPYTKGARLVKEGKETKLGYMDFVPRLLKKRRFGADTYESFSTLVERASLWLAEHKWVRPVTCETVLMTALKTSNINPANACAQRSLNASVKTRFLVIFRLWFEQPLFPSSRTEGCVAEIIECKTFVPRHDQETFQQMVDRANDASVLKGEIISIEVVTLPCRGSAEYRSTMIDTELCYWKEDPEYSRIYAHCVRIYCKRDSTYTDDDVYINGIGYKDFVPQKNGNCKENNGYELHSAVMNRASSWISSQQAVSFISIRTVNIKLKSNMCSSERCVFTEHVCASKRTNVLSGLNAPTNYLTILRVFYTTINSLQAKMAAESDNFMNMQIRLTNRTFVPHPRMLNDASISGELCKGSDYEDAKAVLERINRWFSISGAPLFHIETHALRLSSDMGQKSLGAEATFSQNSIRHRKDCSEIWLYCPRLYLDGEYREPPSAMELVAPAVASHSVTR